MQYLVIAYDSKEPGAEARRLAVRPDHVAAAHKTIASGIMLIGGAILDDDQHMVGSMTVVDFPTQQAFDEWLRNVPYMKAGIWQQVEVKPFHLAVMARN